MTMTYSFSQVAHLYIEILIIIIILIMGAIGYFYQSKFNYKTYYQLFIVAAFLILSVFLHFFVSNYILMNSTLRLLALPSGDVFTSIGLLSPNPFDSKREASTPS